MLALTAAGLICAVTLAWLWLFPLVLQIKRVAVARRGAPDSPATKSPASRPIYPYSIIRGGAYSGAELIDALDRDPVAAQHYLIFRRSAVRTTASSFSAPVFLSYRVGNEIYWTSRPVRLPQGETLLTDGKNFARARCGNRISETPQTPVNEIEPAPETLNKPQLPANTIAELNTWTEDRLMPDGTPIFTEPLAAPVPISAVPGSQPQPETTPSWGSFAPATGFLEAPIIGGIPQALPPTVAIPGITPGIPGVTPGITPGMGLTPGIEPNPFPGLLLPPAPGTPGNFPPELPPTIPLPATPPIAVIAPPGIVPPEIWPSTPAIPVIPLVPEVPEIPNIPNTPIQPVPEIPNIPNTPIQSVPEPNLLPPTLLACAVIAKFRRRR